MDFMFTKFDQFTWRIDITN